MTTIDLQNSKANELRIGITEPPTIRLLIGESRISIFSFPITILLPKNIKITIPSGPLNDEKFESFYNIVLSISLPDDLVMIINADLKDFRNPMGNIVEKTKDVLMGVTGGPFTFHIKEKKYLEFFAPKNGRGERQFSMSKFSFLEMMEEYNKVSFSLREKAGPTEGKNVSQ
jgi:hypothetical protein